MTLHLFTLWPYSNSSFLLVTFMMFADKHFLAVIIWLAFLAAAIIFSLWFPISFWSYCVMFYVLPVFVLFTPM